MTTRPGAGALTPTYEDALAYAGGLHRTQVRKNTNIPYLSHLMSVSALVLEDGGSQDEAIGALLHDAAEDCGDHVLPEIERRYGPAVRAIVKGCSDDLPLAGAAKRPWTERKVEYIDHLRREANLSVVRVSARRPRAATCGGIGRERRWAMSAQTVLVRPSRHHHEVAKLKRTRGAIWPRTKTGQPRRRQPARRRSASSRARAPTRCPRPKRPRSRRNSMR